MSIHPDAQVELDRFQLLLDQGKVCPVCGGALVIFQPTRDGMFDGEPLVGIECRRVAPETDGCWSSMSGDGDYVDPEFEYFHMEYLEEGMNDAIK